jgi:hypothetical protein
MFDRQANGYSGNRFAERAIRRHNASDEKCAALKGGAGRETR